ncbi:hypothetical protein Mapa_007231 [Marchantia paleacea]|nr:hypothetical protein Mapa_007231 [Marchantia paleacea]
MEYREAGEIYNGVQIELYSLATPYGMKVSVALEEKGVEYTINITKGDQIAVEFNAVNPNSKNPAITDPNGPGVMANHSICFRVDLYWCTSGRRQESFYRPIPALSMKLFNVFSSVWEQWVRCLDGLQSDFLCCCQHRDFAEVRSLVSDLDEVCNSVRFRNLT